MVEFAGFLGGVMRALMAFVLCLFASQSWGQNESPFANLRGEADCEFPVTTLTQLPFASGTEILVGIVFAQQADLEKFLRDPGALVTHYNSELARYCKAPGNPNRVIFIAEEIPEVLRKGNPIGNRMADSRFQAVTTDGGVSWEYPPTKSAARDKARVDRLAENERQKQAVEASRLAAAEAQRRTQADFIVKYGAMAFATSGAVVSNPFRYKDTIIGVHTSNSRMLEEDVGIFDERLIVWGVPAASFPSGRRSLVIAVRVLGTKEYMGNMFPNLEYVGVHVCAGGGCSDFFPP